MGNVVSSNLPPAIPSVFGGSGYGKVLGQCSGQLFAFSGLDGPTQSLTNFVGVFKTTPFDLEFCLSTHRILQIRPPNGMILNATISTNDVLVANSSEGASIVIVWSQWNVLLCKVPNGGKVTLVGSKPGPTGCVFSASSSDVLALCTQDGTQFALAYGKTSDDAIKLAQLAVSSFSIDDAFYARIKVYAQTPKVLPQYQELMNKAISVMRVNSLWPEGDIKELWSTPDRLPHKYMWLWDSCYHSMARSVFNSTIGWQFVESLLIVQAESGFIPIERAPKIDYLSTKNIGRPNALQTQPPLLCWAIWENYEFGLIEVSKGVLSKKILLDRLKYAVPRLERYLQWDIINRGDPTGQTPLLFWTKGTESGMDNSQRFDGDATRLAVDFSVFMSRECTYLSQMHTILGNVSAATVWTEKAQNISQAVHKILWDQEKNMYFDREKNNGKFSTVWAVSSLLPIWLPDFPSSRMDAIISALKSEKYFGTPVPLPSVSASTPKFSTDMWRGPMWINFNYMITLGLHTQNQSTLANNLTNRTLAEVNKWYMKHGVIYEFYDAKGEHDPNTLQRKGRASGGVRDYHWSAALVSRMLILQHVQSQI